MYEMQRRQILPLAMAAALLANSIQAADSFEVASVRLSANQQPIQGQTGMAPPFPASPAATLVFSHVTLMGLLARAHSLYVWQVFGPSWMDSTFYDVTAKIPKGAGQKQMALMLQKLLQERFELRLEWEEKTAKGWAITTGRPPLKMIKTTITGDIADSEPAGLLMRRLSMDVKPGSVTYTMQGFTMYGLAMLLWNRMGTPVADVTSLKGAFDFTLETDQDSPRDYASPASIRKSLNTYGLDLVHQEVPTKRLMVQSASKTPLPN